MFRTTYPQLQYWETNRHILVEANDIQGIVCAVSAVKVQPIEKHRKHAVWYWYNNSHVPHTRVVIGIVVGGGVAYTAYNGALRWGEGGIGRMGVVCPGPCVILFSRSMGNRLGNRYTISIATLYPSQPSPPIISLGQYRRKPRRRSFFRDWYRLDILEQRLSYVRVKLYVC